MKKLIVIGAYPNTTKKEDILRKEIESLKNSGFDLMIVSHYPVSVELQSMVDYYIYDKNQTLTPPHLCTHYYFNESNFKINVFNSRHALPICQNMFNSFKFSEIKGYDFVFFVENDNIFAESDIIKFNFLLNEMVKKNKKCIFFKTLPIVNEESSYETQLFGITPKYFNEVFKLPTTEEEWVESNMTFTLEEYFYSRLKTLEDDFLILYGYSKNYFTESQINIFRVDGFIIELLYNMFEPNNPAIFCINNLPNNETKRVLIELNDTVIEDRTFYSLHWFIKNISLDGSILKFTVFNDDETIDYFKTYELTEDILPKLRESGIIEFN
jgi:hypothetical protein